jgi:hypothetical protein
MFPRPMRDELLLHWGWRRCCWETSAGTGLPCSRRIRPLPLLLETRRLRDRITARLEQARDLYLLAAQVCGLLAWQTGNLGNYRAADTHAWTAWMCAEQAGHNGARAWVRATEAMLAAYDGHHTESAQLAQNGLSYSTDDSARGDACPVSRQGAGPHRPAGRCQAVPGSSRD